MGNNTHKDTSDSSSSFEENLYAPKERDTNEEEGSSPKENILRGPAASSPAAQLVKDYTRTPNLMNTPTHQTSIFAAAPAPRLSDSGKLARSSSTSSLYVRNTIGKPDVNEIVECMAVTLFWQIKQSELQADTGFNEIFSVQIPNSPFPTIPIITDYLKKIYFRQSLSAESGVMAMAYLDRLITVTGIQIRPGNWRKVVLSAIMLASKVWEDCAVWNEDFLSVLEGEFSIKDLNQMEYQFLACLKFAVTLKSSV
eukprot:TRINITY_DN316_c0_g1_i1.p1 TRINITY_DN316_c0_g1~~TRINITY_DN316_c0_g1_i1.p1  ORF type:complete len:269 (+),score=68.86 TRINITY_DN316_c0_g1_i1:48-809(+)